MRLGFTLTAVAMPTSGMSPYMKPAKHGNALQGVWVALQVMLWQRKIELEREMNDVLDPSVGGDVVGAMKKEIHRMQLRAAELSRIQESLLLDMERSIAKRDTIALKVTSHCL